jgi:putative transposase
MERLPRIVIPGLPYHVTQRGNRRSQVFFEEGDYELYLDLLSEAAVRSGTEIWYYCLMPNPIHLVAVPSEKDGLRQTFTDAHRRYTGDINAHSRATGHLWQRRFVSVVMDEAHLFYAVRYVSLNPVRAELVHKAQDWRWSSVAVHLSGKDDRLVKVAPILERFGDFAALLGSPEDETAFKSLRQSETTGRPLGSEQWIEQLEKVTGRVLKPQKRGPKKSEHEDK